MKRITPIICAVLSLSLLAGVVPSRIYGDQTKVVVAPTPIPEQTIAIDANMRAQGFAPMFDDAGLGVIVPAQATSKVTSLKLARPMTALEAQSFMTPDPGLSLGSGVYIYDFGKDGQNDISKDITLSLSYSGKDPYAYIAFYDRNKKIWRKLPSTHKNGRIQATTRLPFSQIAILERRSWVTADGVDLWAIPAKAVFVTDEKGDVLLSKNSDQELPIASITKLMTALVFLENNPGWNSVITFKASDDTIPAKFYLSAGDQMKAKDVFYGTLVGSKNNGANMLARSTGLTRAQFVQKMNEKAKALGMTHTTFVEPTGLDEHNISTVRDLTILAQEAYKHPEIVSASTTKDYAFKLVNSNVSMSTKNSNALLGKVKEVKAGKTGYTEEAGFSMVVQSQKNTNGTLTVALLGAPDDATRFDVAGKLVQMATKNGKFTFRIATLP